MNPPAPVRPNAPGPGVCVWAALLLCLPACANLGYYARAAQGQAEISERARPIPEVLADPATPPDLRARLEAAARLRVFATRELGLPDGAGFRTYADLGRPFAVWNVYAAPELSLTPRRWCFPFAGCVSYRGYFSEVEARAFAAGLAAGGDDVYVAGVAAYSTLGWFDDPVLNTFAHYGEPELARLIFHELAHRVAYVGDDTAFNESFATAVELEGVRRWLAAEGSEAQRAALDASQSRRDDFLRLVAQFRERLEVLYASPGDDEFRRAGKTALFRELRVRYENMKVRWAGYAGYDAWFDEGLNNARLASVAAYTDLVPAFQRLLARCNGDLSRFYLAVKGLAGRPPAERRARLEGDTPEGDA